MTMGFMTLFCLVQGIFGFAILPTTGHVRISKLCIAHTDQRASKLALHHHLEPRSLNDMATRDAQQTTRSSENCLWLDTNVPHSATSSMDTAIKGALQTFDSRGHGGPGTTMGFMTLFCLLQVSPNASSFSSFRSDCRSIVVSCRALGVVRMYHMNVFLLVA
ncbi:hypothetical protein HPB50_007852 [Hyalomma asiaticum]|uniref:Uncharacterized protein n=1 Tax=Hyalomma asiaticum TaxID=266040 RepID=A0ACB7TCG0_HYAAI|nr:hypothetical protein HPB50_007852 [Hyalomma asiaticum]